jgi:hypothetical protein
MNAHLQAWLDQDDARMKSVIRRHGWSIEYIGGDCCSVPGCGGGNDEDPPFAYTVGLFGLGHPELLVFALDASSRDAGPGSRDTPDPSNRDRAAFGREAPHQVLS